MNQRFRLIDDEVFINCTNAILTRYKAVNGVLNIIITDDDETRSHAQNRLMWMWLTELSNKLGESKEYYHIYFKRRLLSKIYLRDGTDGRLTKALPSLKVAKELMPHDDYELVADRVAESVSTTKATTKQMSEYLTEIDRWAYAKGVTLTIPNDLQWVME